MSGQARVGDSQVGVCPLHKTPRGVTGTILPGQGIVFQDGKANAIMGNSVIHSCGHVGKVVSVSNIANSGGRGDARVGDQVAGGPTSTIVAGQSVVNTQ